MVSFRVLDSVDDRKEWEEVWARSPMQLPYAHPGYGDLVCPPEGRLLAAVMEHNRSTVLYPFVLRSIDGGPKSDITSPYGYGGPLRWGPDSDAELASRFWAEFDRWAQDHGVVAEFIRFSLFDDVLPYPGTRRPRNLNTVSELPAAADDLWASLHKKVRQGIRRALRFEMEVEIDTRCSRLDDFVRIYSGTMERRASDDWYRFDREFFTRLISALGDRVVMVFAIHNGRAVSANLMLLGADSAYAFLGGTEEGALSLRPTEFMEYHSMNWARENGYRRYVLGGGVTPGDGLERYKQRFAPEGAVMFHTGERVLDPVAFDELVNTRRREFEVADVPWDDDAEFFPPYRRPMPEGLEPVRADMCSVEAMSG